MESKQDYAIETDDDDFTEVVNKKKRRREAKPTTAITNTPDNPISNTTMNSYQATATDLTTPPTHHLSLPESPDPTRFSPFPPTHRPGQKWTVTHIQNA